MCSRHWIQLHPVELALQSQFCQVGYVCENNYKGNTHTGEGGMDTKLYDQFFILPLDGFLYWFQVDPLATPTSSRNNTPTLGLQQQNSIPLASLTDLWNIHTPLVLEGLNHMYSWKSVTWYFTCYKTHYYTFLFCKN